MSKKGWIILIIVVIALLGVGIFFWVNNKNSSQKNNEQYEANRTSTNTNTQNTANKTNSVNTTNSTNQTGNEAPKNETINKVENATQNSEEQLATFSTKIYNKDSARQNNIKITCDTLNGTIVKNGETFSFCNTVGPASTRKGYQEADIFDKDGNKKKGLGGRKLSN